MEEETCITDVRVLNLHKLCKVWGFVKYHHPVFLLGEKCWDEELLLLLPEVLDAGSVPEANYIMLNWITGLEDVDNYPADETALEYRNIPKEDMSIQTDRSWVADEIYLGASLSAELLRLKNVNIIPNEKAPNNFEFGFSSFSNEKPHPAMGFRSNNYRLLGLFRLWNAIEYYFPYKDIMDYDWDDVLLEFIPEMLEGTDRQSYELTLAALSARTNDAHVYFTGQSFFEAEFGSFFAPAYLTRADGRLVVWDIYSGRTSTLRRGDVLLKLDGECIDDVIAHRMQYIAVPCSEKVLIRIAPWLLRSHTETMDITVLRDGVELELSVTGYRVTSAQGIPVINANESFMINKPTVSHELLEGNIGLINPSKLARNQTHEIIREFADTAGLIIDYRQYPADSISHTLPQYVMEYQQPAVIVSIPNPVIPGAFIYQHVSSPPVLGSHASAEFVPPDWENPDNYKKPIVLLMDELSMSNPEYAVMLLRAAPNVVVMGSNSTGADGNIVWLPLPRMDRMAFTGLGVFTPEGGQTQRIGLTPDIYVERTVQGVKEGRDELMEAAIRYIIGDNFIE
ncbi:MAG: S41 family peptidase [Defluviitaleaceae bacterium]|nr:S41 family peptidase [Defluviitaleaceae bacterium]MCL2836049.1 S41 family peptidase [Defluviitaleaceae bacterium]